MSYLTPEELVAASSGVETSRLPPGELANYIQRASKAIDEYCHRNFDHSAAHVERLVSGVGSRAIIDVVGDVMLYPVQRHPINSVASITYALPGQAPVAVNDLARNALIIPNEWGDGEYIQLYNQGVTGNRGPQLKLVWTITYDGGYTVYPDWLKAACIEWTAGLLLKRGAQAIVAQGSGGVVDSSTMGSRIETAQEFLNPHVRRF